MESPEGFRRARTIRLAAASLRFLSGYTWAWGSPARGADKKGPNHRFVGRTLTFPLATLRSRLEAQGSGPLCEERYDGLVSCAQSVWQEEGVWGTVSLFLSPSHLAALLLTSSARVLPRLLDALGLAGRASGLVVRSVRAHPVVPLLGYPLRQHGRGRRGLSLRDPKQQGQLW